MRVIACYIISLKVQSYQNCDSFWLFTMGTYQQRQLRFLKIGVKVYVLFAFFLTLIFIDIILFYDFFTFFQVFIAFWNLKFAFSSIYLLDKHLCFTLIKRHCHKRYSFHITSLYENKNTKVNKIEMRICQIDGLIQFNMIILCLLLMWLLTKKIVSTLNVF